MSLIYSSSSLMNYSKLSPLALGLAFGILCALSMLLIGLRPMLAGSGQQTISLIGERYRGFDPTTTGILLGIVYGFLDGFIGGALLAWLYNRFVG